ncbi:ComF family protein [bacterium]|jgi:predicted amidophosphoribosyltransferase|nr:ComF family protein [bacterium]
MNRFLDYLSSIFNLLFPESCISCNKLGDLFCPLCQESIKFSLNNKNILLKREKNAFNDTSIKIYYSTDYQKIKKILHSIKFDHKKEMIQFWSKSKGLKNAIDSLTKSISGPILTTIVPSHKNRLEKRGYNIVLDIYSEHIIDLQKNNKYINFNPNFFTRIKDTKPLFVLDKKNRYIQLNNAFSITAKNKNSKNKNMTLIIFDDICTTGQTLIELKKMTKNLNFKQVIAFSLAYQSL